MTEAGADVNVLITGAAGFIGSHVAGEAARPGRHLRLLAHRRPVALSAADSQVVTADIADPATLHGVCEGIDVLLHCASYVGSLPETNTRVNAQGTGQLVEEARRAGVSRIVYVSTASVYGRGTFRNALPDNLDRNPSSPTSQSRMAAEDAVLAAGGLVLRPHLVYGKGDAWVVPGLLRLLDALPASVDGWQAQVSVIAARELARLVVAAGFVALSDLSARIYHAAQPAPVEVGTLLRTVAEATGRPWPDQDLPMDRARALLTDDRQSAHALAMLGTDHWFDSSPFWRDLDLAPGPDFVAGFEASQS